MNWNNKTKSEKVRFIVKVAIWVLLALLVVFAIFGKSWFGANSVFGQVFTGEGGFKMIGDWIDKQAPVILKAIVYITIAVAISYLVRFLLSKLLLVTKRGQTAAKMIDSFIKYFTALIVIIMVLLVFGVDPLALFASLGILGLVIGLAAQSLISDIISGLFIVFEGAYEVGDWIVIEGFRGKVLAIGIRTTQLVDYGGNNKIINNSQIKTVINLSHEDSLFSVEVKVKHADFAKAEKVIKANLDKIAQQFPHLSYGPNYAGVNDFTNEGVELKFTGKVEESIRFSTTRELRRAIKVLFDENNISIATPKFFIEEVKSE